MFSLGIDQHAPFGSVDGDSVFAKNYGEKSLGHDSESGCNPGCKGDWQNSATPVSERPQDAELARVITAWPHLSAPLKAAILSLIATTLPLSVTPPEANKTA